MTNFEIKDSILIKYNGSEDEVAIPTGVTAIGKEAFWYCENLKKIHIPDSVTYIGDSAFSWCNSLTNITISNGVTSIGKEAFLGCTSLTSIVIPGIVDSIGEWAFGYCEKLKTIYCEELEKPRGWNINWLGDSHPNLIWGHDIAEEKRKLEVSAMGALGSKTKRSAPKETDITAKKATVKKKRAIIAAISALLIITFSAWYIFFDIGNFVIENGAVKDYKGSRENIVIPYGVTGIGNYAFAGCSGIVNVYIPNGVTSIGAGAFNNCVRLENVTIPSSVTHIDYRVFSGVVQMESITIPDSITSMSEGVFDGCDYLQTIYCESPEQPNSWSNDWLGDCKAKVVWGYKG